MQGITQVVDAEGGTVQNIADFRIANLINGYLNVEGTVAPVMGTGEAVRVDVKFTAFCLKIGALPQLKVPLGWSNPIVSYSSPLTGNLQHLQLHIKACGCAARSHKLSSIPYRASQLTHVLQAALVSSICAVHRAGWTLHTWIRTHE